ncbi:MAG: family 20 glycosylhydrolase [Flavobacteriales bacterium]|nr:family 20 glycosylhydrolase [Flavobacteriales bacterium]
MKKYLIYALALVWMGCGSGMPDHIEECPSIIPQPSQMMCFDGSWSSEAGMTIEVNERSKEEGEWLADWLDKRMGARPEILQKRSKAPGKGNIYLNVIKGDTTSEGYTIQVHPDFVWITAESGHGIFNGLQTLRQLAGAEFEVRGGSTLTLPFIMIEDHPQFGHRGMLLDCCRHFMEPEFVKRYIDLLAFHKMNTLHWHLTEDQGWRIAIEKYPLLTEIGAWRTEEDGSRYGGFYSRSEMEDIVAYAKRQHITIIPEIEMPGHSVAALAAYPELSCRQVPVEVEHEWGVFKDIYCAGNDSTLAFLKDVLLEVMEIFPSEYIHIGGDEAPKFRWEHCDKCQQRIQTMGLADEHELQSWFIGEINTFLQQHGRQLIGWDEILEGGLPKGTAVQSWRGMDGGMQAALSGHAVVMSPTSHCYFDYGLDATDVEEVYGFDPIPAELPDSLHRWILGGECNMWTEHAPQETVDSKVFPRMVALSEVLWSYPESRNYGEFHRRLTDHYSMLDALGVDYGFECVPIQINARTGSGGMDVEAVAQLDPVSIGWSSAAMPEEVMDYLGPLHITGRQEMVFHTQWKGKTYGDIPFGVCFHRGINHDFKLNYAYSPFYTGGGDSALVDGILGTTNFRDGHWQALQFENMDIEIDLGAETELNGIATRFYQYNNAWIFLPTEVVISAANAAGEWTEVARLKHTIPLEEKGQFIHEFTLDRAFTASKIRMEAINIGKNPDWHDSPGEPSWLFCDELILK